MKITKEQIEEMKDLFQKGFTIKLLSATYNLNHHTVRYWVDPKVRDKKKTDAKAYSKKLSKEKVKEHNQKRKEYFKKYYMDRYDKDEAFRTKHIIRCRRYFNNRYHTDEEFRKKCLGI